MNSLKFYTCCIVLCFSFMHSCLFNTAEKEIFLIPEGYKGTIVILFNQEDGEKMKYQENARIYTIPINGVLYTQFTRTKGVLNHKYYYMSAKGDKIREIMPLISVKEDVDSSLVYRLDMFDGKIYVNPRVNEDRTSYSNKEAKEIKYTYFSIGTINDAKRFISESHHKMDSVIQSFKER